jgi:hypothetical protein
MPFSQVDHKDIFNASIASGALGTVDLDVSGYSFVTAWWQLLGTTTAADMTVPSIFPYKGDGLTLLPITLPALRTQVPVSDGANINAWQQLDIRGFKKVQFSFKNNNVGAKVGTITVMLGTGSL